MVPLLYCTLLSTPYSCPLPWPTSENEHLNFFSRRVRRQSGKYHRIFSPTPLKTDEPAIFIGYHYIAETLCFKGFYSDIFVDKIASTCRYCRKSEK